ncbi:hypothetical protein FACS189450_04800 [Spirochaetia bacterium]|nr:hypothetical protein FACS189450_04800 [Spirochaetia bacterium]
MVRGHKVRKNYSPFAFPLWFLATQLTVADAINKLGSARLGLHSAIFEYRSAYYDLENTVGLNN